MLLFIFQVVLFTCFDFVIFSATMFRLPVVLFSFSVVLFNFLGGRVYVLVFMILLVMLISCVVLFSYCVVGPV